MAFDRITFLHSALLYCVATGASETSGFRTPEHNRKVGGKPDSPHVAALGRDVVYDDARHDQQARDEIAATFGLELIHEGDHDHLQPRGWGAGAR